MNKVDHNRLEEFRQLREEIRGSEEYLIVGIDVGKDRHNAFLGTATGKTLFRRLVFSNDMEGFKKLLDQTEAIRMRHGLRKVVFGLEPTANYHKPLGGYLIKLGQRVVLVSGVGVKRNRELLDGRWDKHDMKDAANVADLISQGKCLYYEYPLLALTGLRNLLSLKRRLKKQEHGYKIRIRNHLLAQYFPELDRYYGQSESLAMVRWCLSPSQIVGLTYDEFVQKVTTRPMGMKQRRRLEAIWDKAADSIGCDAGEAVAFEAQVMVEGLEQIRETMKATEAKIKEICDQFPEYLCLLSIPGFGPDVSSKVLGAIGDPFRFKSGRQVLKMSGFDLSANRSGKRTNEVTPVISKKGKADLRYALFQAALIASVKNRDFMVYYRNKLRGREKEKGIKIKMRVKLAAKLLIIAWTLMKKKERFNHNYLHIE